MDSYFNEVDGKNGRCHCTLPDIVTQVSPSIAVVSPRRKKNTAHISKMHKVELKDTYPREKRTLSLHSVTQQRTDAIFTSWVVQATER